MYLQASHPRHRRAQAAASATRRHEPLVAGDGGGEPGARYLVSQVDMVVTFDLAAGRPQDPCRHGLRHQLGLELGVFEELWRVATRESSICLCCGALAFVYYTILPVDRSGVQQEKTSFPVAA